MTSILRTITGYYHVIIFSIHQVSGTNLFGKIQPKVDFRSFFLLMPTFNQEFEGFSSLNHENIVVEGFKSLKESEGTAPEFVVDALTARLSSKISNADSQQLESLLEIGVSCLLCFVQAGWTGPDLSFTSGQLLSANGDVDVYSF